MLQTRIVHSLMIELHYMFQAEIFQQILARLGGDIKELQIYPI
jgi:hypothetical protein